MDRQAATGAAGERMEGGMRMKLKPIRVFFSGLSGRFYATRAYKIDDRGLVTVTGEKFDVTNDIASLIAKHGINFKAVDPPKEPTP